MGARVKVLVGLVATVVAGVTATLAWAAPAEIKTTASDTFSAPSFTHDAGTVAKLIHTGGGPHNVTASDLGPDHQALFRSSTISNGQTPVRGSQYLAAGSYPFVCTRHPGMGATLIVTGTFSQARPTARVKALDRSLRRVVKNDELRARVTITGSEKVVITARFAANNKLASFSKTVVGAGTKTVDLGQSTDQQRIFKHFLKIQRSVPVRITAVPDFGSPARDRTVLKH
jgi:plastocyanin